MVEIDIRKVPTEEIRRRNEQENLDRLWENILSRLAKSRKERNEENI